MKFGEGLEVLGTDECQSNGRRYYGVFQGSAVEQVDLPRTLKRVEYSAFAGCKGLKLILLPENLEYLGKWCF